MLGFASAKDATYPLSVGPYTVAWPVSKLRIGIGAEADAKA